MDPELAFRALLDALEEQVATRVRSVQNGEDFMATRPPVVGMPHGASIFETRGPWEDFATPSRDLRLLIAIDVVRTFPDRVAASPGRYALGARSPREARDALVSMLRVETARRGVEYRRSDGSSWRLTLADVMARTSALEVAYNPNDCVETRWGAPAGSDEARPCRRRAPEEQRARMTTYRTWFRERRRPPRESPRASRETVREPTDDDAW